MRAILEVFTDLPAVVRGVLAYSAISIIVVILFFAAMGLIHLLEMYMAWAAGEKPESAEDESESGRG